MKKQELLEIIDHIRMMADPDGGLSPLTAVAEIYELASDVLAKNGYEPTTRMIEKIDQQGIKYLISDENTEE